MNNEELSFSMPEALRKCLPAHISVIAADDNNYTQSTATWNIRVQYQPVAVVQPTTVDDVSLIIKSAKNIGISQVAVRGGSHSFEGLSLGGRNGAMVIDMVKMNHVCSDPGKSELTAQGGALLSQVHTEAHHTGRKMVPLGTCPSVGLAGQIQSGGYGFYSRTYGPLVDRAIAFEMVTADGQILHVDKDHHADLFYAVRGSGTGSFGVITSVTLRTNDIPASIANFSVIWKLSNSEIPHIFKRLQAACLWAPKSINTMVMAWVEKFEVFGTILASSHSERDTIWAEFLASLPESSDVRMVPMDYLESVMDISKRQTSAPWYNSLSEIQREGKQHLRYMKIKSGYIPDPLPDDAIERIGAYLTTQPPTGVRVQLLALDPEHVPQPDHTSIRARRCHWLMGMSVYITQREHQENELLSEGDKRMPWLNQAYNLFLPFASGAYIGDDDLEEGEDESSLFLSFYGSHLPRLSSIKAKYDPANLFHHPLSIPLPK
ncbi:hypothetical protein BJX96DRAFT_187927 [Aspergillus floccosus]